MVHRYKGTVAFLNRLHEEIDSPPVRGESRVIGNDWRFCENDCGFLTEAQIPRYWKKISTKSKKWAEKENNKRPQNPLGWKRNGFMCS